MATLDTLAQDIKDLTEIVSNYVVPSLTKLQSDVSGLKQSVFGLDKSVSGLKQDFKDLSKRVNQIDEKLDIVAQKITTSENSTISRLRMIESKTGIIHD